MKILAIAEFIKFHKKTSTVLVLGVGLVAFFIFRGETNNTENISRAEIGPVIQEISVTGRVKPSQAVDLAFDRSGRILHVGVKSGDVVSRGRLLVQLDASEILAQEQREKASVAAAELRLNQVLAAANNKQGDASAMANALSKTLKLVIDTMIDFTDIQYKYFSAYTGLANDLAWWKEEILRLIYGQSDLGRAEAWYFTALNSGLKLQIDQFQKDLNKAQIDLLISSTKEVLLTTKASLELMQSGLAGERNVSQADIDKVNSGIDVILGQISDVSARRKNIVGEGYEIEIVQSQLEQARASLSLVQAQLSKYKLTAPFSGIAANIDIKSGHIVSPNVPVVSLISNNKFQIEANVSEADIAKILIGNKARVKLDAYGRDQTFNAKLVAIDPGGRVVDGVAIYKATFEFDSNDDRILSGLTADVDVIANQKENVLFVSSRDITSKNGKKYVKVKAESKNVDERFANLSVASEIGEYKIIEVPVEIGLKGSDGRTEIISGLKEGDVIVNF